MNRILIIVIFLIGYFISNAQDTINTEQKQNVPVKKTFETSYLLEQPTVMQPTKGSIEFMIQHRFGEIKNGISDLFGIYASANTRLSISYGISDLFTIGFGTTQGQKLQDFNWKVNLFRQTKSWSIPITISYYGNAVINASNKSVFGDPAYYKFIHRLSYFNSIIVACKLNKSISMQVAPSISYFNAIQDSSFSNLNFGLSIGARAKITKSIAVIGEYQTPFTKATNNPKPNASLGFEIGTATHSFQLFVASYNSLVNQYNFTTNQSDFTKQQLRIGFNITVRF